MTEQDQARVALIDDLAAAVCTAGACLRAALGGACGDDDQAHLLDAALAAIEKGEKASGEFRT